jgi:hypothetical protein
MFGGYAAAGAAKSFAVGVLWTTTPTVAISNTLLCAVS